MSSYFFLPLRKFLRPKNLFLISCLLFTLTLTVLWQLPDNNLHIISCDVGQGDATLITYKFSQMLVDGGPGNKVLDCLSKYMPFWDRTIEMVMLTHPQDDHLAGLIPVIQRYRVEYFVTGKGGNTTAGYHELLSQLKEKVDCCQLKVLNLYTGDQINVGGIRGEIIWPQREWVVENLADTDVDGREVAFANGVVLGAKSVRDPNDYSLMVRVNKGSVSFLGTGDGDSTLDPLLLASNRLSPVTILKYPHHGSKTGATKEFLQAVQPQLAVISVGAKNRYGHPAPETLDLLNILKIPYLRTDLSGDVEVITDGEKWWAK